MLEIKDVPYRRWHRGALVETKAGKKVMALAFREMGRGKAVELVQSQPKTDIPSPGEIVNLVRSDVYDTISLTVTD